MLGLSKGVSASSELKETKIWRVSESSRPASVTKSWKSFQKAETWDPLMRALCVVLNSERVYAPFFLYVVDSVCPYISVF